MFIKETAPMDETDPPGPYGYYIGPNVDMNTGAILDGSGKSISDEKEKKGKEHPSNCTCAKCEKERQEDETSRHTPSVPDDPQQVRMGNVQEMRFNEFEPEVNEDIESDKKRLLIADREGDSLAAENAATRIRASETKKKSGHHELSLPIDTINQVNDASREKFKKAKSLSVQQGNVTTDVAASESDPRTWGRAWGITDSINKTLPILYESHGYISKEATFTPIGNSSASPFTAIIEGSNGDGQLGVRVNGEVRFLDVSPLFKKAFVEGNTHYRITPKEEPIMEEVKEPAVINEAKDEKSLFANEYLINGLKPPKKLALKEKDSFSMRGYVNNQKADAGILNEKRKTTPNGFLTEEVKISEEVQNKTKEGLKPYLKKCYPSDLNKAAW